MYKRYVRVVYTRGGDQEERFDLIIGTGGAFLNNIVAQAAALYLTPTVLELGGKLTPKDGHHTVRLRLGTTPSISSDSALHRPSSSASSRRPASVAFISTAAFSAQRYRRRGLSYQSIYIYRRSAIPAFAPP
jgi:hypothetical protein